MLFFILYVYIFVFEQKENPLWFDLVESNIKEKQKKKQQARKTNAQWVIKEWELYHIIYKM